MIGIYKILNTVTNQSYFGSSSNIYKRWNKHKSTLRRGIHANPYLQSAWNKYGSEAFEFTVVLECETDQLVKLEQEFLDKNQDGYNLAKDARLPWLGRSLSEAHKEKLRQALTGIKHPPRSIISRQNLSLAKRDPEAKGCTFNKRSNKWVAQISIMGKYKHLGYFSSQEEARAAYRSAKIEAGII